MKRYLLSWLPLLVFCGWAQAGQSPLQAAQTCIAANLGAASVDCLQQLEQDLQKQIQQQQKRQQKYWQQRLKREEILQAHYQQALSETRLANRAFSQFSENQCRAVAGASGAAGSGHGQIYWTCRIDWANRRLEFLKQSSKN